MGFINSLKLEYLILFSQRYLGEHFDLNVFFTFT